MDIILNESRQVYISKINRVQDYIEGHLDEELCIGQLARVASFSEFHFQRIFRQFTGESLYSFIKRLRLEKAVFLLRTNSQLTIQEIALAVGFSNQASFAKALKERYGACASVIRKAADSEISKLVNEISINGKVSGRNLYYDIPVDFHIMQIDPVKVLYVRHTGAYKGDSDLFAKLFTRLGSFADKRGFVGPGTKWYVAYHDYGDLTEEEKLRLSVCMSFEGDFESRSEFGCMELAGGKYAVGRFLLEADRYQNAWNYMVSKWLPESGYMPDDRLCFEYYPPQENEKDSTRRVVEIYIPITPL